MTVLTALSALLLLAPAPGLPGADQAPPQVADDATAVQPPRVADDATAVQPLAYDVNLSSDAAGARWDGRQRIVLRNPGPSTMDHRWCAISHGRPAPSAA